jgi:hypothetical protein
MHARSLIFATAVVAAVVDPARAQNAMPFGAPWFMAPPEAANGLAGAGAASDFTILQQCVLISGGRGGPRYQCTPAPAAPEPARR